jgi:flavodoxin
MLFALSSRSNSELPQPSSGDGNIFIAYFTNPEPDGVDAVSSASRVVVNGKVIGNTQFIAQTIQSTLSGELFVIEMVDAYPTRPKLMDLSTNEKKQNARPAISSLPENLDAYDVVFLGYPNWWADMPMPLYTFLESVDLSGKTIIPFCSHGGNGFSRTKRTIAELQPGAIVSENSFSVSRQAVPDSESDIIAWLQSLNLAR